MLSIISCFVKRFNFRLQGEMFFIHFFYCGVRSPEYFKKRWIFWILYFGPKLYNYRIEKTLDGTV